MTLEQPGHASMDAKQTTVPRHIGIILDGNRRFAKRLMLKPWKGHEWGAKKLSSVLAWCRELGVQEVTIYAFSIENFNRPKEEFDELMRIFKDECERMLNDTKLEADRDVRISFIGRTWMFPATLQTAINAVQDKTASYGPFKLNLAMAYGGRAEVIDATKKLATMVKEGTLAIDQINEDVFAKQLYIESEPDLIIRTSGEQRTSGFLLWQGSYAELYFCEKLWPEFEKEDLHKAIATFTQRERRFGK
ncbi:MAG: polyprenyl diphosphate synthase [Nanoarchaeota archaeon]